MILLSATAANQLLLPDSALVMKPADICSSYSVEKRFDRPKYTSRLVANNKTRRFEALRSEYPNSRPTPRSSNISIYPLAEIPDRDPERKKSDYSFFKSKIADIIIGRNIEQNSIPFSFLNTNTQSRHTIYLTIFEVPFVSIFTCLPKFSTIVIETKNYLHKFS